jgi:Txe/YoeB family toxin of Txe-Axe toxin-antitoxin module
MPIISDLRPDIAAFLRKRGLWKKWRKAQQLFEADPSHTSLNTELLEPKHRLIYSFRIDLKHRALFICHPNEKIEIIAITKHYRKS